MSRQGASGTVGLSSLACAEAIERHVVQPQGLHIDQAWPSTGTGSHLQCIGKGPAIVVCWILTFGCAPLGPVPMEGLDPAAPRTGWGFNTSRKF